MSRQHDGGFIGGADYWDIGTDAQRGRDGDTAREAAKKFNDHRHVAAIKASPESLNNWANELEDVSESPSSGLQGGYIEQSNQLLRKPGDAASYNGHLYATTTAGTKCTTSGFGPHIAISGGVPVIEADYISSIRSFNLGEYSPLGVSTQVATLKLGHVVMYESIGAYVGDLETRTVIAAGLLLSEEFPLADYENVKPAISISVFTRRHPYDPATGRIEVGNPVTDAPVFLTAYASDQHTNTVVDAPTGYTVKEISNVAGNFVGKIDVMYSLNVDGCYTETEVATITTATGESEADFNARLQGDLERVVKFDIIDLSAHVFCTFGG